MRSTNQGQPDSYEGKERSPLAFRFSKGQQKNVEKASPFTEMPDELRGARYGPGGALRKLLNTLLMIILLAALAALIAAFAYQLVNNPQMLAASSQNLVDTLRNFFQSLFTTG